MLLRIELPLALPVIVAGLRIAAVTVISVTVVAAYVNAGGLGTLIFNGIASDHAPKIWSGALTACALAIAVDGTLARSSAPARRTAPDRRMLDASVAIPRCASGAVRGSVGVHVALSAAALGVAAGIAIPRAFASAHRPRAALPAINAANIGRTLPSLAVLALVMPLLGTGFLPSLFALTLLALPPILINTLDGVRGSRPGHRRRRARHGDDDARDLGKIELPLAMPVIFAGLRTAAVQVISGAVLAAYIGGGGLGDFITAGIAMMAVPQLLVGADPGDAAGARRRLRCSVRCRTAHDPARNAAANHDRHRALVEAIRGIRNAGRRRFVAVDR